MLAISGGAISVAVPVIGFLGALIIYILSHRDDAIKARLQSKLNACDVVLREFDGARKSLWVALEPHRHAQVEEDGKNQENVLMRESESAGDSFWDHMRVARRTAYAHDLQDIFEVVMRLQHTGHRVLIHSQMVLGERDRATYLSHRQDNPERVLSAPFRKHLENHDKSKQKLNESRYTYDTLNTFADRLLRDKSRTLVRMQGVPWWDRWSADQDTMSDSAGALTALLKADPDVREEWEKAGLHDPRQA